MASTQRAVIDGATTVDGVIFTLPATPVEANQLANELHCSDEWIRAKRAAIVYAQVRPRKKCGRPSRETVANGLLSAEQYAKLGIQGLKSKTTVWHYWTMWHQATSGQPVKLGDTVQLPVLPKDMRGRNRPKTTCICKFVDAVSMERCDRLAIKNGYCGTHNNQDRRTGRTWAIRPNGEQPIGYTRPGKGGYIWIKTADGWRQQHQVVMEGILGRSLVPGEEVHHKNLQRDDNSPSNLELWLTSQPRGARVVDLIDYVVTNHRAAVEYALNHDHQEADLRRIAAV